MRKISIYTDEEVAALREGGHILSSILKELVSRVKPGVTTGDLDALAEKRMKEHGGTGSFKGYLAGGKVPFNGVVCTSVNSEVVHGIPYPARPVKDGDTISLDIGMRYKGLCTDMAVTVPVGRVTEQARKLMHVTRAALFAGVDKVKPGTAIREIGRAIQPICEKAGYGVVRDLTGHGVGHEIHEEPPVPNYDDPDLPRVVMKKGMVIAIEPMVNAGTWEVEMLADEWTIVTADGKLSAHFEVTVAVTEDGHEILTPLPV